MPQQVDFTGRGTLFKRVPRPFLGILVLLIYGGLMEALVFVVHKTTKAGLISTELHTLLWLVVALGWILSWFTTEPVDEDKEGVPLFLGQPVRLFSLGKGYNPLPVGFGVKQVVTTLTTLNLPQNYDPSKGVNGFTVTSKDKVTMSARANVPHLISDPFLSLTTFDKDSIITVMRDAIIQVVRDLSGNLNSEDLQTGKDVILRENDQWTDIPLSTRDFEEFQGKNTIPMIEYFRVNIKHKLEQILKGYPIGIDYRGITIPKFLPPASVQTEQEKFLAAQAQKRSEQVEQEHIQNLIKKRADFYMSKEGGKFEAQRAIEMAREEVLSSLNKIPQKTIRFLGGSDLERAAASIGIGNQP